MVEDKQNTNGDKTGNSKNVHKVIRRIIRKYYIIDRIYWQKL